MTRILAHRGNVKGPCAAAENRLPTIGAALSRGWNVQIDVRRAPDGSFHVSHDDRAHLVGRSADAYCALFRRYPAARVGIRVGDGGHGRALIEYLDRQGILPQVFLCDDGSSSPGALRSLHQVHPGVRLAARVSDRAAIDQALANRAPILWLDEANEPWCGEADVRRMKEAARIVYAVSPDVRGVPVDLARRRWVEFECWGVDGICTDYPAEVERTLFGMAFLIA